MIVKIYKVPTYRNNERTKKYEYQYTTYDVYADLPEGQIKHKKLLRIDSIELKNRNYKRGTWGVKEIIRKWYPDTKIEFEIIPLSNYIIF